MRERVLFLMVRLMEDERGAFYGEWDCAVELRAVGLQFNLPLGE
jgi:hypothetical protein